MATKLPILKPGAALATMSPRGVSLTERVRRTNLWRESYNPVAGLNMARARFLLESYGRGEFADLMWTFGAPMTGIETADADLLALIELRAAAVTELDWDVKLKADTTRGFDQALAEDQAAALREYYEGLDNLYQGIAHLCLATFRGFSHLEIGLTKLEIVDQWNVVRDGLRGAWKYNPEARQTNFAGLSADLLMEPGRFVIREVARPVGRIALVKFIRENLSQKDWDAFIEIYGIPGGVVTMPPNVPTEKETAYQSAAEEIAKGGSGALPNGATYEANSMPAGASPFEAHLKRLSEKLVLAGTGGKLTMLAESGSGTLAGGAHSDTFALIGKKEAREISELFQKQIDRQFLAQGFPGLPQLAYFALGQNEENDAGEFVDDVAKLATAGFQVDPAQITEKTGYQVTIKPPTPAAAAYPGALTNREKPKGTPAPAPRRPLAEDPELGKFMASARGLLAGATAADLQPLRDAISKVLQSDDADLPARLKALRADLPRLAPLIIQAKASSEQLYQILSAAAASALVTPEK